MIEKLKKALYTVDESDPGADVIVCITDDGLIQAWSISRFRAACVIAQGKRGLGKVERAIPASVLRKAKSLSKALASNETSALPMGDWRVKALRALDNENKVAVAIARVSDLRKIEELYTQSLPVNDLYCELVIGEGGIECVSRFAKVSIPAELTLPGRICVNHRYLVEAVQNLVTQDTVGVAIVQNKDLHILMLESEHERHYIAEMKKKR